MTQGPDHATELGTPNAPTTTKLLLLGSGELGKEIVLEAQGLGIETIAVDRYENAPAMQAAHRSHIIDMTKPDQIRKIVALEEPDLVVPEIEAIATSELENLEEEGYHVVPNAEATRLTMDREAIRRFAVDEVGVPTSDFAFADSEEAYREAIEAIGLPAVVKPTMSSSGKGQTVVRGEEEVMPAWKKARKGSRADTGRVIVEDFVAFDAEITLLTVRHRDGVTVCPPIGHTQAGGDYRESWQPADIPGDVVEEAADQARAVTEGLGGFGLFGVEFFIADGEVLFSELSPRPHDTGLVTLASQRESEFELHLRAVLGLPVPEEVAVRSPGASCVILAEDDVDEPVFRGVPEALQGSTVKVRLFGKPRGYEGRRMGVAVAEGVSVEEARERARGGALAISVDEGA